MPVCERCREIPLVRGKRSNFPGVCRACYRNLGNTVQQNNKRAKRAKTFGALRTVDWCRALAEHDFSCASCGVRHGDELQQGPKRNRMAYLTLDHQHPISRGGLNTIHNILPLCQVCHAIKDGDPDVMPWDKEKVMARRERKNKARAFFHYLVREVVGVNDATYYLEMRQKHVEAAELDGDESTFGEFLTEHLLMTYVDLVRSGDLPMRKWGF